jgi:hypothetical protein
MSNNITTLSLIIEDKEFIQAVNSIRESHDPGFKKWTFPHINILGPFVPSDNLRIGSDNFTSQFYALNFEPFEVVFESISFFKLGMTYYIYLKPDTVSENKLIQVHNLINGLFPENINESYKPYMIIGHSYHPFLKQNIIKFNEQLKDMLNKKFMIRDLQGFIPSKFAIMDDTSTMHRFITMKF